MGNRHYGLHGIQVVELGPVGTPLQNDRDAVDAIAAALRHRPDIIVIPTGRLDAGFFRLRTGIAGAVVQKFLTYGLRLAIVGDISTHLHDSSALRDFVYECNNGSHIWFVASIEELSQRLQPRKA
jgi:hypothetical protein